MKAKSDLTIFRLRNISMLFSFLIFSFIVMGQNAESTSERKGYLGLGIGSILHLDDENNMYDVGINSSLEGSYSISRYVGVTAQVGFNKFRVSPHDEIYLLVENLEYMPWYSTIDYNKVDAKPGMNMVYVIGGPLFTFPSGRLNFDFSPKAGVAFISPFYQYDYTIEGYSNYGFYDRDVVSYEGAFTTAFLLDIELALRVQLTNSGWGFKFFTKYIHSSFTSKMTRSHTYESRDYPGGPVAVTSKSEGSNTQKAEINSLILGLSLIYSF